MILNKRRVDINFGNLESKKIPMREIMLAQDTHTVDGSEILHQLRLVACPIIYRVLAPSQVVLGDLHGKYPIIYKGFISLWRGFQPSTTYLQDFPYVVETRRPKTIEFHKKSPFQQHRNLQKSRVFGGLVGSWFFNRLSRKTGEIFCGKFGIPDVFFAEPWICFCLVIFLMEKGISWDENRHRKPIMYTPVN